MILPGLRRPVGTIWCAGRNYAEHAKELGNGIPSSPMIFLKPASSLMVDGGILRLPSDSKRVDHEVELVIDLLARGCTQAQVIQQYDHLSSDDIHACLGYAVEYLQSEKVYALPR